MNAFLDGFASLIDYFVTQWQQILSLTIEHIEMTAIAVGCSILIGVPLGILVSYVRKLGKPVIGIANVVRAKVRTLFGSLARATTALAMLW